MAEILIFVELQKGQEAKRKTDMAKGKSSGRSKLILQKQEISMGTSSNLAGGKAFAAARRH
ncbi:MAG: hypothetical protein ACNS62_09220 [Candidatus Cyclobacteriaceae bacterium M3_2C_046]